MIRATDDKALATELWGEAKRWDDDLAQYVPTDKIENDPEVAQPAQEAQEPQPVDTPTDTKPRKSASPSTRTQG